MNGVWEAMRVRWGTGCGIVNWRAEGHGRLEKEACVLDAWFRHRRVITPPKIKQ